MSGREMSFPPDGAELPGVRAAVREIAVGLNAAPSVGDNLALVVDELVNNAIEHGAAYRKEAKDLRVSIARDGDRLAMEFVDPEMPADQVADLAAALDSRVDDVPALESERGRGLFLLTVYLEDLRAQQGEHGGMILSGRIQRQ